LDTKKTLQGRWVDAAIWLVVLVLAFHRYIHLGFGDLKDWDECLYAWRAKIICFGYPGAWLDQSPLALLLEFKLEPVCPVALFE